MRFISGQHIHIVGIGGSGMSAIARVLLLRGFKISGSDRAANSLTDALKADGATIFIGHDAANVDGADMVLTTSAVKPDHVEIVAAREKHIPVYKRNEIMAALMEGQRVIAAAGTHGKTTTTSMIIHLLRECGKDPSYIVGGVMGNTGTNAGVGQGDIFVIEADEYDHMFLGLRPNIAVITNVEWDHPDFFKTEADLYNAFEQFVDLLDDGILLVCSDSPLAKQLAARHAAKNHTSYAYGLNQDATYQVRNIHAGADGYTHFELIEGDAVIPVRIMLSGTHNALNAAAAIAAVAHAAQIPVREAASAIATFITTGRRFDVRGEVDDVTVIDDYAHHPTAIRATLEAAKTRYPDQTLWAVWQPHTYSRTQALMEKYLTAFENADHVLVTDIYAAREQPLSGVDAASVAKAIQHPDAVHSGDIQQTIAMLKERVQPPSVIVIMSAGDAPKIGEAYLAWRLGQLGTSDG